MPKYYPPIFFENSFHCPHCGVYSHHDWVSVYTRRNAQFVKIPEIMISECMHCDHSSYWMFEHLTHPDSSIAEPFHEDFPETLKADYQEAASIFSKSPRASAALIRLVLQKLMVILGEDGKDINDNIGSLVRKGLPPDIQKAMDICRIVGNKAVHPGEIDLNDTPETAAALFSLINYIVEDRIARPKKLAALFDRLPEGAKKAIEKRDGKSIEGA